MALTLVDQDSKEVSVPSLCSLSVPLHWMDTVDRDEAPGESRAARWKEPGSPKHHIEATSQEPEAPALK